MKKLEACVKWNLHHQNSFWRKHVSLKLTKQNYKLSQNLASTKSKNKVTGPSSRAGFKLKPDHEAGNSFSNRNQQFLNYQGQKMTYKSTTLLSHSQEHQIQEILTACTENVSKFNYFSPKL